MKLLNLLLNAPVLILLLTSCDATSTNVQRSEQLQVVDNTVQNTEEETINIRTSVKKDEIKVEDYSPSEWEPRIIKTPVSQIHKRFNLPESNIQKIKTYFYDDIDISKIEGKNLEEDDYELYGYVEYSDGSIVDYTFDKDEGNYLGKKVYLAVSYQMSEDFNDFHKDIIYKILDVSGVENPKLFFKELLDSPKITKYEGCTVQLKQSEYSMVDLTSCASDDVTALSLYNPELE